MKIKGVVSVPDVANNPSKKMEFKPSRREFAAIGTVAAMWSGSAGAAPLAVAAKPKKASPLKVEVKGDLFRPESGDYPGLVMYSYAAASRAANAAVAHQLASQGWAVLLVDTDTDKSAADINRDAKRHVAWLMAQEGVSSNSAVSFAKQGSDRGFALRSYSAAQTKLSLADRDQRRKAAASSVLFAAPEGLVAKSEARRESLFAAARALHRFAA
ncbi:hypothetical protein [Sphingorhabdus sp.]|uniref:hypothetical protein n=1 Tax=Sphingorhabdus sp. TaxID=1902408 RepID=UPI003BB13615|nr:hypothetical protein [Sphingomonadales bacterium]MBK9433230.1 hypothetical protein [Sphingomonadales bacterium]MBL0022237.1 hypothetical protein [Sphingomonadales bacterium]